MLSLPLSLKYSAGPLIAGITALVLFFLEPASNALLAYDRYALQGWETWRVITGNLVHTNGYHLLLNLAGLLLLWLLFAEHLTAFRFLKVFIWCCLGTSLGIYWYSPDLIWYAGLSGALHGVFAWGACRDITKNVVSGWLLLVGVLVLHLAMFRRHGITAESSPKRSDQYFWPQQVLKDGLACLFLFVAVVAIVWWRDGAELTGPAEPTEGYKAARPEWYFLFLFQFLKYFPGEYGRALRERRRSHRRRDT